MLNINFYLKDLTEYLVQTILNSNTEIMLLVILLTCLLLLSFVLMTKKPSRKVYLIDFACYKPPTTQKCSQELALKQARVLGCFSEDMLDFLKKMLERSGVGDSSYLAEVYFGKSYKPSMQDARREVEMSIFGSVDMLLAKTGVRREDIRILIVNCCVYNSVPSLSSIIVNRYKLRENIVTYNLAGMGCSAGIHAVGLAKQLLQRALPIASTLEKTVPKPSSTSSFVWEVLRFSSPTVPQTTRIPNTNLFTQYTPTHQVQINPTTVFSRKKITTE
ncbi:3-ketoacyl-CoA synthase 11-like protein [Tanacetum coccineum]